MHPQALSHTLEHTHTHVHTHTHIHTHTHKQTHTHTHTHIHTHTHTHKTHKRPMCGLLTEGSLYHSQAQQGSGTRS